jgi:hypothetical protein
MLGIDSQSGRQTEDEPGRDAGLLKGSEAVHLECEKKEEVYVWVSACLGAQNWDFHGVGANLPILRRTLSSYPLPC